MRLGLLLTLLCAPALAQVPQNEPAKGASQSPRSPEVLRLKSLLQQTGLKTVALDEEGLTYGIPFEPKKAKNQKVWLVSVQYANPASKKFILVYAVMFKLPEKGDVPRRLLWSAMDYNSRIPGSKLAYNKDNRSLDVQFEIPAEFVTPELLAWAINDVAATCDDNYERFTELLGD